MAILTPEYVMKLEYGMRMATLNEYQVLAPEANAACAGMYVERPSSSEKERLIWLWDTAGIQEVSKDGKEVEYHDMTMTTVLYEHRAMSAGLKLDRNRFEDLDGGGVNAANEWSRQTGEYAAYWKPKKLFEAVRNGTLSTSTTYDGLPFFTATTGHPFNPNNTQAGRFDNVFTGSAETTAANGLNPGACPITGANPATDITNLYKAVNFIQSKMKMPNGEDPRRLKVNKLWYPTALKQAVLQALNAEFIAGTLASSSGTSGSVDVRAVVKALAPIEPVEVVELGADYTNGSDTAYYLGCQPRGDLGAIIYYNREPFHIIYNSPMTDVLLNRANSLEWIGRGRFSTHYGHPFLMFKCLAT